MKKKRAEVKTTIVCLHTEIWRMLSFSLFIHLNDSSKTIVGQWRKIL